MNVFLTSAYPYHDIGNFAVGWLTELAIKYPSKKHAIVSNPEQADIILFLEHHPSSDPYFFKVLKHPLTKQFKEKVVLYTDADKPIAILPTLTPSIEKKYLNTKLSVSAPYIERHAKNDSIKYTKLLNDRKYLFSFLGSCTTHPVRSEILKINYQNCFLKDTSDLVFWKLEPDEKIKLTTESVSINKQSYFILCPRGVGANTYRVYEVMQMGLVPVIISDEWVPYDGPVWEDFSIQIKEKDVLKLPEILLKRKGDALKMGVLARKNWEDWFSEEVFFTNLIDLSEQLFLNMSSNKVKNYFYSYSQFLRPYHFKNLLRYLKRTSENIKITKQVLT